MKLFGAAHQFIAVHLGHQEVAQDQVERAGKRSLEHLHRFLRGVDRDDAVATGFEQEGAYGEHLFVVVYAEDRLLGAHRVSLLPEAPFWWLAADRPAGASADWPLDPPGAFKIPPWPGLPGLFGRDGSSAPGEGQAKERG